MTLRVTFSNTEGEDFRMNHYTVAVDGELVKMRITVEEAITEDKATLRAFILAKVDEFRTELETAL